MELIDFDGLFDEKLAEYIEQNKEKYTEKQWESVIPRLYKKFGDTYVAKIKCTPKEYYAKMTGEELVETLRKHLILDVPVPEFLCAEIEGRDVNEELLKLFSVEEESVANYVVNLVGADTRAYDTYFEILVQEKFDEELRSDITDILRSDADLVKEKALAFYRDGKAKEYMLEILSRVKTRDEVVFDLLLEAFLADDEKRQIRASYLAAYGDEQALPYLLNAIEDKSIGFVEFQELKYAIEALGGEYNEPRDFTSDKDYVAVENAGFVSQDDLNR